MRTLVLASGSRFRRELLARLGLPFQASSPDIDETRLPGESPNAMVRRLSREKAEALRPAHPDALIIGSDQCAVIGSTVLGKPGHLDRAREQLALASGREVVFHTGLCLLDTANGGTQIDDITFRVLFRDLCTAEIDDYLKREEPFQCAGSFKSEGLGVALFSRMRGDDPTALVGLPLIRLVAMLQQAGMPVLGDEPAPAEWSPPLPQ